MDRREHIHIISAGETIHLTYPALFRTLPTITRTYVLADSEVYALASDPGIEKERLAVRHAVDSVKEISTSLSIAFARETVFAPVYPSVRAILTKIHREYPEARYSFDLSGGSKPLCMALFACAPWVGGEVYSSFDEKIPRGIPLPDRDVRGMMGNVNYQTILAFLLRNRIIVKDVSDDKWISRQYLYTQVGSYYSRSRTVNPRPDEPDKTVARYKKGHKPAQNMSQATFSGFIANLREAGLIEEGHVPDNQKERMYRITEAGETAFRFFSDPAANSIVKMILEDS